MAKVKCFYKSSYNAEKRLEKEFNTLEECANWAAHKYDKRAYDAIMLRGYFMISYGPSQLIVEEEEEKVESTAEVLI